MTKLAPPGTSEERQGYNTNLASEFFVLSMLYRLRLAASLTLGNKKGVDIVVACAPGKAFTVEVKAVAGKNDWLVGSLGLTPRERHFVVLVGYEGQFADLSTQPTVWIFGHDELSFRIKSSKNGKARYISRKEVIDQCPTARNAWDVLAEAAG